MFPILDITLRVGIFVGQDSDPVGLMTGSESIGILSHDKKSQPLRVRNFISRSVMSTV